MTIYFGRPFEGYLDQCRGVENTDTNQQIVLAKKSVESVAKAFSGLKQMTVWERDAYNREVLIHQDSTFIFQLIGHSWSIIFKPDLFSSEFFLSEEDAQNLSRLLATDTIYYIGSDTGGFSSYHFFRNGISTERFYFEEEVKIEFQSLRRQIDTSKVKGFKGYDFTINFIREQDAYVPYVMGNSPTNEKQIIPGNRPILRFENLFEEEVVRMDYLARNSS